ncbi:TonB-dependent receptor [Pedobacter sp. L105]|uniref:SusC/RagA family TonB-linked outer membrane protein n=1 Tax=Pedobacter sp. L105 TaxID=1641871 RepID=UPI00131AC5EA|nr:TonB-dependent receptor [Pedobacter sp. L105]
MKKLLQIVFLLLLCVSFAMAQDRTISGRVTGSEDGRPLPGVTIRLKGAQSGTSTASDGRFSLKVPPGAKTLEFAFIGYLSQSRSVSSNDVINVVLEPSYNDLSEVQITGYSTVLKKENTSSIATVTGDAISNLPVTSFNQSLAGRAAGVQVNTSSGIVGAPVNIRIRGISSLTSGSQPLIVVDGVPITQNNNGQLYNSADPLGDINPNDIETLDILKDAAATALYGSRGAAGVILITTRQGKAGITKVTYDTYFGYNEPSKKIDVLNADQYNSVINQKRSNAGLSAIAAYGDYDGNGTVDKASTDWQDEVYRKGGIMSHEFAVSSGTEKTSVFASASYLDYDNYIRVNQARRGSARLNITHSVNNWFKVGINTQYSRNLQNGLGSGTGGTLSGIPYGPFFYYPNVPVKVNGDYYTGHGGNSLTLNIPNPRAVLDQNYDNFDTKRFLGSGFAEVSLLPGLKIKSTYGVDYQTGLSTNYWNNGIGDGAGLGGLVQEVYNESLVWNWANTITYNKVIAEDHTINLLGGAEYNKNSTRYLYARASGASDPFYTQFIGSAFTNSVANGGIQNNGFDSYFGSANYSYKQKYLATATYRADAYSGFGIDHRRGGFPSGALAWRFTQEDFLKNNSILSEGKLRASYGLTGNSNIGNYPSLSTYAPVTYANLGGASLSNPGNPDLKWEKTRQLDIGVDATLFEKVNIVLDYYDKKTNDLILNNPVPATLGFPSNQVTENIGAISNKGFEFTANASPINTKNFQWYINFNIAYNKSKVISTDANNDDITPTAATYYSIARPGHEIGSYYLIRWAGVNAQTGLAQFLDANGNTKMYNPATGAWTDPATGKIVSAITSTDKVLLDRSYIPKFAGGLTNDFKYKNIDLSVFLQFATDFYVYDNTRRALLGQTNFNNSTEILNSWTTPGQITDNQKLYYGDATSTQASTRFLERGDFIRGKNLQLGYSLPVAIERKMSLSRVRIYLQVQNAFTITGYKGTNPEVNSNNTGSSDADRNIGGGVDSYTPYLARTYALGLNVGF